MSFNVKQKKCPACAMQIPSEANKCPYCQTIQKKGLPLGCVVITAALILMLLIIGMCSSNHHKQASFTESSSPKTFIRGPVSCSNKHDMITTYAVFIGRAAACRESFDEPMKYVGTWIDTCFDDPRERAMQLVIFANGVKYHAENQKNGNSPDSCSSVAKTFYSVTWPDYEPNKVENQPQPVSQYPSPPTSTERVPLPVTSTKMPYIDKEKGIDTTK